MDAMDSTGTRGGGGVRVTVVVGVCDVSSRPGWGETHHCKEGVRWERGTRVGRSEGGWKRRVQREREMGGGRGLVPGASGCRARCGE